MQEASRGGGREGGLVLRLLSYDLCGSSTSRKRRSGPRSCGRKITSTTTSTTLRTRRPLRRRRVRRADARATGDRGEPPGADHAGLADAAGGGAPIEAFGIVEHRQPMLSLANAFSEDELRAWYACVASWRSARTSSAGLRAEDRRPRVCAGVRERLASCRGRRAATAARREHHAEPAHDPQHPARDCKRQAEIRRSASRCAARST